MQHSRSNQEIATLGIGSRASFCAAAILRRACRSWVIRDRDGRGRTSGHFRFASKADVNSRHRGVSRWVESRCGAVAVGRTYLLSASFVWRCLSGSAMTPFPHPAHRTGQADLPHPALGQDLTPLRSRVFSRATPSAVSEHSSELIGCPISRVLHYVLRSS